MKLKEIPDRLWTSLTNREVSKLTNTTTQSVAVYRSRHNKPKAPTERKLRNVPDVDLVDVKKAVKKYNVSFNTIYLEKRRRGKK